MTEDAIRNLLSYNFHHTFIKSLINKLVAKLQKLQNVSQNCRFNHRVLVERIDPSRKVLYHFAIRAIINEILMIKDRPIRACISRSRARGEKRPPNIA